MKPSDGPFEKSATVGHARRLAGDRQNAPGIVAGMHVDALLCSRCGGQLARPASLPALVDCLFCGAVMSVSLEATVKTHAAAPEQVRHAARMAFTGALKEALAARVDPYRAICNASAAHLGTAGQSDTVACITIALAHDFEREEGVDLMEDAIALTRLAEGYLKSVHELQNERETEINLPYLAVSASGPRHYSRKVTAGLFAELARRPVTGASTPVAAPAGGIQAAPLPVEGGLPATTKKRGWWPFRR